MKLIVKPRRAATVALVRDSSDRRMIEVLLMKRHLNDRFLPGYHVFPGGAVDERDNPTSLNYDEHLNGMALSSADEKVNYLTHVICAIRETFEESGILLAENSNGYISMDDPETHERFTSYRKKIFKGELEMMEMLRLEGLEPSFNSIYYLTRWITPVFFPMRYDTRFFIAVSPGEQRTCHDGDELITSEWINPRRALEMYRKGTIKLVTPTINTIEFLGRFSTSDEVVDHLISESVISPARSF